MYTPTHPPPPHTHTHLHTHLHTPHTHTHTPAHTPTHTHTPPPTHTHISLSLSLSLYLSRGARVRLRDDLWRLIDADRREFDARYRRVVQELCIQRLMAVRLRYRYVSEKSVYTDLTAQMYQGTRTLAVENFFLSKKKQICA
jgi:hypothetical protein